MRYQTLEEIIKASNERNLSFAEIIIQDDMQERQVTRDESMNEMQKMYLAMKQSERTYDPNQKSKSGLSGGDAGRMETYVRAGKNVSGAFIGKVMIRAICMGECNACMKRIVAAPTAGSCGVIPAVLLSYEETKKVEESRMVEALFVAAGIGQIIAARASISGAEGGCQAEIGSASAMAAGAMAYLEGGDNKQIINASALALKNMLGLVCDPVAGLVEVPCVKRNVSGAVNAVVSADMSMAGIFSAIPADEVIDAMGEIGRAMPQQYRETGKGGLAVTPTGAAIGKNLTNEREDIKI